MKSNDLGISEPALRRWVRADTKPEDPTSKRLADAKDTVNILKKSIGIFIKS